MTCGSGCCGPPKSPAGATPELLHQQLPLMDDGNDACYDGDSTINKAGKVACGEDMEPDPPAITKFTRNNASYGAHNKPARRPSRHPAEAPVIGNCRKTEMGGGYHELFDIDLSGRQDVCCSGPIKKTQGSVVCGAEDLKVDDNCCSANSTDDDCKNRCCSAPDPSQVEDPNNPSCCKDRPSPCCDVSCLDRLALRACDSEKQAAQLDQTSKSKQHCPLQLRCLLLMSPIYSSHLVSVKFPVQRKQRWKTMWPPRSYHP
jgi:Cu2+-exporting ATPase